MRDVSDRPGNFGSVQGEVIYFNFFFLGDIFFFLLET